VNPELQPLVDAYRLIDPSLGAIVPVVLVSLFSIAALVADLFELGTTRGPAEGEEGLAIMAPYLSILGVVLGLVAIGWQALRLDVMAGSYFNGMIVVDGFGVFLAAVILVGTLITLLVTIGYCRRENIQLAEYYYLVLMSAVGMMLLVQSNNLVMIFAALELMSVGVYVLTGFRRRRSRAIEGALKYFVLGAFSTGFLVYGMALLYGLTGTFDLPGLGVVVDDGGASPLLLIGLGLVLVGFSFKVALVPFHMWSPDVYQAAPAPITGFMATGVKTAAFAALARFLMTSFDGLANQWMPILWVLAVLTMFVGNVAAIRQDDIKRMLAYSSIAHAGYLVVALVADSALGNAAFVYYLAAYTLMTLGAFAVVVALGVSGDESTSISRDYSGAAYRHPMLGAAMALFMFSLIGIPPTAGFFGKFAVFSAAVDAGHVGLAVLMVIASVISAYFYLKVVVAMYMGAPEGEPARIEVPAMATIALIATVVGVLALGIYPGGWIDLARASVAGLGGVAALP
jgi:NADH-quinone oxidoreductase subunit N